MGLPVQCPFGSVIPPGREGRTLKIFWYCCSSLKFDIVSFASSVTVYVYGVDVYSCLTGAEYFTFTYNLYRIYLCDIHCSTPFIA